MAKAKPKTKAPILTLAEGTYLRQLAVAKTPVAIKMANGKVIRGAVEISDADVIRLSQPNAASLFLFKEEIQYLWEEPL
jgi:hypothetical protein